MCGIFGTINHRLNATNVFPHLSHRGPDENNYEDCGNLQLFHSRLSIVDIAGGRQPLHHNQLTIIYNGEFYNHLEIRKKYNLQCKTQSDTETLLRFFELKRESCFDEIDGMFALAIFDRKKNTLVLARDRAGKKPLYLYNNNRSMAFSSELNAIARNFDLTINHNAIEKYLKGCLFSEHTPYNEVKEIVAGSYATIDLSTSKITHQQWWAISDFYKLPKINDYDEALSQVNKCLRTSVTQRLLQSDLEVGTFLSGGIDSGIVTSIAAELNNNIKSFTVKFQGEYDESEIAKLVANKYNTDHHEINIDFSDLATSFETIVASYGEPFADSSAIPSFYVAREAKKHVSVILNGDGADEIFGGYRRYVPFANFDIFKNRKYFGGIASLLLKILPHSNNKKNLYNYFYRLLNIFSSNDEELYWYATTDTFDGYEQHFSRSQSEELFVEIKVLIEKNQSLSSLEKMMLLDFNILLFGVLLVKMDIATMQNSLEGRSPFLSKSVLELAPRLPNEFKVHGKNTKCILRDLGKQYLPTEVITQPKRGFEIPLKSWMNNELNPLVKDYIGSPNSFSREFISDNFISELLNKPSNFPGEKRAKMLYQLLALEVWKKSL